MPDRKQNGPDVSQARERALSRWENEGGRPGLHPQVSLPSQEFLPEVPQLSNAELVQLRVCVIALENLIIALLAEASDRQLSLVREMASNISPRPGFTHHPLTTHAADHMVDLVERAGRFRVTTAL